jgi:hypothetical protein
LLPFGAIVGHVAAPFTVLTIGGYIDTLHKHQGHIITSPGTPCRAAPMPQLTTQPAAQMKSSTPISH